MAAGTLQTISFLGNTDLVKDFSPQIIHQAHARQIFHQRTKNKGTPTVIHKSCARNTAGPAITTLIKICFQTILGCQIKPKTMFIWETGAHHQHIPHSLIFHIAAHIFNDLRIKQIHDLVRQRELSFLLQEPDGNAHKALTHRIHAVQKILVEWRPVIFIKNLAVSDHDYVMSGQMGPL